MNLSLLLSIAIFGLTFVRSFPFAAHYVFAKEVGNPLVYHLSSDEPWRATVAISDATTLLKLGHNITLLLSMEGVQIGVKHPHYYLGLDQVTENVTNFISEGERSFFVKYVLE